LFHTPTEVTRTALTDFSDDAAAQGDDGMIPAVDVYAESIPIDAATQPLNLRETEVPITATGTGTLRIFNPAGATLNEGYYVPRAGNKMHVRSFE
jgi:hypothetical protein